MTLLSENRRIDILDLEGIPGLQRDGIGGEFFPGYRPTNRHIHTHDIVELVFVCAGYGRHILQDREQPAGPGSLAIIHYNQAHGFDTGTQGLDLINLYLDLKRYPLPALPDEYTDVLPRIIPLHPSLAHRQRDIVHIQFDSPARPQQLLKFVLDELREQPTGYRESVRHLLALFMTACCRQFAQQEKLESHASRKSTKPELIMQRLEALRLHIDTHFADDIQLDDLAKFAGLQKNYLCRIFKQHTGQTLFHYLMHRRLERTLLLLRQTDLKIIDIAQESGFNDLPHFNRIFKREIGLAPTKYRKKWNRLIPE